MKSVFYLTVFLIFSSISSAQLRPESYLLQKDNDYLSKNSSSTPISNSIADIITIGDTVWLGTSRGVSVSFDRGESWTNFYGTEPFGQDGATAIAHDTSNGTIWAATVTSVEAPGGGTVPKGTGLKYTTNNGLNWTSLPQPVDNQTDTLQIFGVNTLRTTPITVSEQNVTYDIDFTPGSVWITSFAGGTRRSTDMGETWQRIILPTDSLNSISPSDSLRGVNLCIAPVAGNFCSVGWLNYRAFSVIAVNDSTVYIGTANGINKTTNANDPNPSWVKLNHQNQVNPISGNFVVAFGYNNSTLWSATRLAEGIGEFTAVSSTSDDGENWNTFLRGERVWNFGSKGNSVFAPSDNGVFRTSNNGNTWILPSSIVDPNTNYLLSTKVFYSAASQGNDIWLGSNDGLARLRETISGFWTGEWKVYIASTPLKNNNETYCFPNPFNPRGDVELKIKYSTGGEPKKVTIRIFDFAMNLVKTVIQNADRIRNIDDNPDKWDGRDENGNYVPNGVYFYRVDFDNDNPVFGKILVLQ